MSEERKYYHIMEMDNIINNIHDDDAYFDWESVVGQRQEIMDIPMLSPKRAWEIMADEKTYRAVEKMFKHICKRRREDVLRKALAAC